MSVKPILLLIGAASLILAAAFGVSSLRFLADSAQTEATVTDVAARNQRCGRSGKNRRRRYDCTVFTASVRFAHDGTEYTASLGAGKTRGHDQSPNMANLRVGQTLPVQYRKSAPNNEIYRADRSTTLAVWGKSLLALIFGVVFVFIGIVSGRRRG
jgi:Protein of unknown function (DUF3592)